MIDETLNIIWIQMLIMYVWIAAMKLSNSSILSEKCSFSWVITPTVCYGNTARCVRFSWRPVSKTHSPFGSKTAAHQKIQKSHLNAPGAASDICVNFQGGPMCSASFTSSPRRAKEHPPCPCGTKTAVWCVCRPPVYPQQGNSTLTRRDQLTLSNVDAMT